MWFMWDLVEMGPWILILHSYNVEEIDWKRKSITVENENDESEIVGTK